MNSAVIYARVSSREQEREGYSIPAQLKLLHEYARQRGLKVVREFVDVESAKNPGRREFGNTLRFLETDEQCRMILVEKTDRLYRNRTDALRVEQLEQERDIEVHLVKENTVIGKDSRSQVRFTHDVHVAVAKFYSENLREEVKKGMREKAEQGIYPGHAPFGYRNDRLTRSIRVDPKKAPAVKRIFELYASGTHSLTSLRQAVRSETGFLINRSYLETILKNRFYLGFFCWQGIEYKGIHQPIIDAVLFQRVQNVFASRNKGKRCKHDFAFAGLLSCAHDGCTITTELHKGKYIYYRCSYGRGRCDLPYMPESRVSEQLGSILKNLYVPEHVVTAIVESMSEDQARAEDQRAAQITSAQQRLSALRTRMDQAYEDKLDGKLDEQMWTRKIRDWREQEIELEATLHLLETPITAENVLTAQRTLELANRAYSLYFTRDHAERGQLLKSVLLNCATDGVNLTPTYRKPFDLIFQRAKNEEWSGRAD
ncbi:MAG TPA: recombinase family protein, partial [Terriglobales bacterium]|nr:recombinase family protein [Terriglobales bacterium]